MQPCEAGPLGVLSPTIRAGNSQLAPVLGYRSTSDAVTTTVEFLGHRLVRERLSSILPFEDCSHDLTQIVPGGRIGGPRGYLKEMPQWQDPPGTLHVLSIDCTADRADVNFKDLSHLSHGEGHQVSWPILEEGALALEDLGCDYIVHHIGYDERRGIAARGERMPSPLDNLRAVVDAVSIPVQAVGGLTIEQAVQCPAYGAPLVVLGAPLTIDADAFKTADGDLEASLKLICDQVHAKSV